MPFSASEHTPPQSDPYLGLKVTLGLTFIYLVLVAAIVLILMNASSNL
jgi:hypothetical protein